MNRINGTRTQILILLTGVVWILWDIYVYYHGGNPATESATVFLWSYYSPGFSFMAGILMGHFFFQMKAPTAFPDETINMIKMKG